VRRDNFLELPDAGRPVWRQRFNLRRGMWRLLPAAAGFSGVHPDHLRALRESGRRLQRGRLELPRRLPAIAVRRVLSPEHVVHHHHADELQRAGW
jgi:hypothetical protein